MEGILNGSELARAALDPATPPERIAAALATLKGGNPEHRTEEMRSFISENDARRFLGNISRTAIWKLRKRGGLKAYRLGRRVVYAPGDLKRFVEKGAGADA